MLSVIDGLFSIFFCLFCIGFKASGYGIMKSFKRSSVSLKVFFLFTLFVFLSQVYVFFFVCARSHAQILEVVIWSPVSAVFMRLMEVQLPIGALHLDGIMLGASSH